MDKFRLKAIQELQKPNKKTKGYYADLFPLSRSQIRLVAEVFNPNRFSGKTNQFGLRAGEAFDIELGWDLLKKNNQQSILSYLRTERPGLVIISPACTKFSSLTHLSLNLRSKSWRALKKHTEELRKARELLQFAVKVCLVCLELGLSFL